MPRGARLAFSNAFYHVFNRGVNKENIFLSKEDYSFFLHKLIKLRQKYDHSIYAYCLMPNHFHLSIHTRKISISKIMSSLLTSYSQYFNKRYKHSGPVFQNRFKSILIENDKYFLKISQYIYVNPVKSGIVKNPLLYPYSGLGEALGEKPLIVLDNDIIRLIGDTEKSKENYRQFIYEGINKDLSEIGDLFEKEESVFGSNLFITTSKKKYFRHHQKD